MYLDHPSALEYKEIYLEPALFLKFGNIDELHAQAREKVKQVLADHHFELPEHRRRDVENVFASAVREIEKKGTLS